MKCGARIQGQDAGPASGTGYGAGSATPAAGSGAGAVPQGAAPYQPPQGTYGAPGAPSGADGEFVLQPLGFGELFDATIKLYTRYFWLLVGTVAVVFIPLILIGALIVGVIVVPGFFALAVAMVVQQGAMVKIVSDIYMGESPGIGKAYRAALGKIGAILVAGLLYGLACGVGFLFCIVPGVYLWVAMSFYICAIMFENKGPTECLGRSMELVRGSWWKIFLVLFLAQMLMGVVSNLPAMFTGIIAAVVEEAVLVRPLGNLAGSVLQVFVAPIVTIVTILMYYDMRVRKEGYDLERMAREIG